MEKKKSHFLRNIGIVILLIISLFPVYIISIYAINYIRVKTFKPPEKFANIPEGAKWKGGVDGGYWFYLLGKQDSIYKIEIYNDYNGEPYNKEILNNEKDFVICQECKGLLDTVDNMMNYLYCNSGERIYLDIFDKNKKRCYLELLSQHNIKLNK